MKIFFLFGLICAPLISVSAQEIMGEIKGVVYVQDTRQPLSNVHVLLNETEWATITNEKGEFSLLNIKPGRYILKASSMGYQVLEKEVLVNSTQTIQLELSLMESVRVLQNVVISEDVYLTDLKNGEGKSVTVEQTGRIPANFFDPVRMMTSFPGVMTANDQANNLIVRGNSPSSMQWMLEGMDIVNPNHHANAGTLSDLPVQNGGGVNIMSAQVLDKTELIYGNVSPQYGNGISHMNMSFRNGRDETAHTLQASLIGLDFASEGQVGRGNYLINYRYSTVGVLTELFGLDFGGEKINFQDLSFNFSHPTRKGQLKIFGFGGIGYNRFKFSEEIWSTEKDFQVINYIGKTGGTGILYENKGWSAGLIFSQSDQYRESITNQVAEDYFSPFDTYFDRSETLLSGRLNGQKRYNDKALLTYGGSLNLKTNKLNLQIDQTLVADLQYNPMSYQNLIFQPYINLRRSLATKWLLDLGLRNYVDLTENKYIPEPRFSVEFVLNEASSIKLGIGEQAVPVSGLTQLLSGMKSLPSQENFWYFESSIKKDINISAWVNRYVTLDYKLNFADNWKLVSSLYAYAGRDIPLYDSYIEDPKDPNTLNVSFEECDGSEFNFLENLNTVKDSVRGSSKNYGMEVFVEKRIHRNYFVMAGGSWYRSMYSGIFGEFYNSRFNGRYTMNATAGYEKFYVGKKSRVLNVNLRMLMLGNIQELQMLSNYNYLYYYSDAEFVNTLGGYFRIDLNVSYTTIREKTKSILSLDLQNVTNHKNGAATYFDRYQRKILVKDQLGLMPVLTYRVVLNSGS